MREVKSILEGLNTSRVEEAKNDRLRYRGDGSRVASHNVNVVLYNLLEDIRNSDDLKECKAIMKDVKAFIKEFPYGGDESVTSWSTIMKKLKEAEQKIKDLSGKKRVSESVEVIDEAVNSGDTFTDIAKMLDVLNDSKRKISDRLKAQRVMKFRYLRQSKSYVEFYSLDLVDASIEENADKNLDIRFKCSGKMVSVDLDKDDDTYYGSADVDSSDTNYIMLSEIRKIISGDRNRTIFVNSAEEACNIISLAIWKPCEDYLKNPTDKVETSIKNLVETYMSKKGYMNYLIKELNKVD